MSVIEKSLLNERLRKRFSVVGNTAFKLGSYVQLITDADELLRYSDIKTSASIVVNSTGYKLCLTVPAGKRWRFRGYYYYSVDGTWTATSVWISPSAAGVPHMSLDTFASINLRAYTFANQIPLEAGWCIGIYVDAKTADGHVILYALVEEEDSF